MIALDELLAQVPEIDQITDTGLRDGTRTTLAGLARKSLWERFEDIPTYPGSTVTGLLHMRHVLSATLQFARSLEETHEVVLNTDLIIAGGLLQDASKMLEYEPAGDGGCVHSLTYGIFPHATIGAVTALEAGVDLRVIDIIINHSPRSLVKPKVLEGRLLRIMDEADAIAIGVL